MGGGRKILTTFKTEIKIVAQIGFNKQPYCTAHYPKPEHSTIADDPESVRLRQQQQNVSNIEYHKEFQEKIKGNYFINNEIAALSIIQFDISIFGKLGFISFVRKIRYHKNHRYGLNDIILKPFQS